MNYNEGSRKYLCRSRLAGPYHDSWKRPDRSRSQFDHQLGCQRQHDRFIDLSGGSLNFIGKVSNSGTYQSGAVELADLAGYPRP